MKMVEADLLKWDVMKIVQVNLDCISQDTNSRPRGDSC